MSLTKIASIIVVLLYFLQGIAYADTAKPAETQPYVAVKYNSDILLSNGKWNYVIDPSSLQETIQKDGFAVVKIHGTNLWLQINKSGDLVVHGARLKNTPYFVLAPLKTLDGADDGINYKAAAYVTAQSDSVVYPKEFCTDCAAPTHVDNRAHDVAAAVIALARMNSRQNSEINDEN